MKNLKAILLIICAAFLVFCWIQGCRDLNEGSVSDEMSDEIAGEDVDIVPIKCEIDTQVKLVGPRDVAKEVCDGYLNVPLSIDLQDCIFALCNDYGIEPTVVIAIIERESTYDASTIGDNGDSLGLMQVQPKWHGDRMAALGCQDLLNPYQNVTVGIDYLGELIGRNRDLEWALMAYNGGPSYANRMVKNGGVSDYAIEVIARSEELKGE